MTNSITIYADPDFKGKSTTLTIGDYPNISYNPGDDKISSVAVAKDWYVQLFEHPGFRGNSIFLFEGGAKKLPGWDDRISSLKVFKYPGNFLPLVEFFEHPKCEGFRQTLACPGQSMAFDYPFVRDDKITSIKVPEATRIIIYKDPGLKGDSYELGQGEHDLRHYGFDDCISSVEIVRTNLTLVNVEYSEESERANNGTPKALVEIGNNDSDQTHVIEVQLTNSQSSTVTRIWNQASTLGNSVSLSTSAQVSNGIISSEISTTITSTMEETITVGEEESATETTTFQKAVHMTVPPRHTAKATIMLTPKTYVVNAYYTFKYEGSNLTEKAHATIFVDTYQRGETVITTTPHSIDDGSEVTV